jgi:membrane-associated phospholipid phosphatase
VTRAERGVLLASVLVLLGLVLPLTVLVRDAWPPLKDLDNDTSSTLTLAHGPARDVALGLTQLGAPVLLEIAAVVIAFLVRRKLAGYVLVTVFGAELLSTLLKEAVSRVRPCVDVASCPGTSSYPSGHATGAAAFWTVLAVLLLPRLGRRAWVLLAVPVIVAATRVLLGVHYLSDVLAGLLVGGCWAAAWTVLLAARRDQRAGRDVPLEEGL